MLKESLETGFHCFLSISDSVRNHDHSYFEFGYVCSGCARSQIGDQDEQIITVGDYFIIDVETHHKYTATNLGDFSIFNIGFTQKLFNISFTLNNKLKNLLEIHFSKQGSNINIPNITDSVFHDDNGRIKNLLDIIITEYDEKKPGYFDNIRCLFSIILTETLRKAQDRAESSLPAGIIPNIIGIIEKESDKHIKLGDICEHLGYDLSYVSRCFKKQIGISFCEYLQRKRLEKSCELLRISTQKISVIAELSGYSDIKFFNTVFKRYMGITPKEYRKIYMDK